MPLTSALICSLGLIASLVLRCRDLVPEHFVSKCGAKVSSALRCSV